MQGNVLNKDDWSQMKPKAFDPTPDQDYMMSVSEDFTVSLGQVIHDAIRASGFEIRKAGDEQLAAREELTRQAQELNMGYAPDACADCGLPRGEHHYNGACYGVCGQYRANGQSRD